MSAEGNLRVQQVVAECRLAIREAEIGNVSGGVSGELSIVPYGPQHRESWTRYIADSPSSTLAHRLEWKTVVEESFGHQSRYLIALRGGEVVGILPLFLVRSLFFGKFLVTSPYLSFGGLVCDDDAAATGLTDRAVQIARSESVAYVAIRNSVPNENSTDLVSKYFTLVLDLRDGTEKVWESRLRASARRNVNKARANGLTIVHGHEYLDQFVEINRENMRRLGTPAHGRHFFHKIVEHLPESRLLMVKQGPILIGGTLLVHFKGTTFMPWIASLPEYLGLRPNNLLYWAAIEWASEQGFAAIDFGRSKADSGTYRFKTQYGAEPKGLDYRYFLNTASKAPDVDPDNPMYRSMIAVWRKLPMPIVRLMGPHIIRGIP